MNRRAAIAGLAAFGYSAFGGSGRAAEQVRLTQMGLVTYCCRLRRKQEQTEQAGRDLFKPLAFLRHCRQLGTGGMQAALGVLPDRESEQIGEFAKQHGLFVEGIVAPPKDAADLARFSAELQTAARVGARVVRAVIMPGRRYERFEKLAEFREFEKRGMRMLELAAPTAEKMKVALAVENHKDQRANERVQLLRHIDSEYVGACVDTGNSFALLEDPLETATALAPWAKSVHLKDQAVQPYQDGFLLGDIPLGQGCLDLKSIVGILRKAQPRIHFSLELITRDPLKVPCLTDPYWATMPSVPARDLARALRVVRDQSANSLQQVSSMPLAAQVALEDANVASSIQYARQTLGL